MSQASSHFDVANSVAKPVMLLSHGFGTESPNASTSNFTSKHPRATHASNAPFKPQQLSFSFVFLNDDTRKRAKKTGHTTTENLPESLPAVDASLIQVDFEHLSQYAPLQLQCGNIPVAVQKAWSVLIPAIAEMAWHFHYDHLTPIQHARKVKSLMRKESKGMDCGFEPDSWIMGLLLSLGIVPREDKDENFCLKGGKPKKMREMLKTQNVSSEARHDALICLEMLCAKAWYLHHVKGMDDQHVFASLYTALQYLYWECGTPVAYGLASDSHEHDPCASAARNQAYQPLYVLEQQEQLQSLIDCIKDGTTALMQYRLGRQNRLLKKMRRDPRWNRTFSQHGELIQAKYAKFDVPDVPDHFARQTLSFKEGKDSAAAAPLTPSLRHKLP